MDGRIIENGEVLVRAGQIQAVGTRLCQSHPKEERRDLGRCALLPGFVNAHSHIDYTFAQNAYDGLNLWDWIDRVGCNKNRKPDYETLLASAVLGAAELACSGVTCLGDSTPSGAAAKAVESVGLRGIVYQEIFGQSMGENYASTFAGLLDEVRGLQSRVSPLLTIGISPHTIYTSNRELLELCGQVCVELNMPVAIHLAETAEETDYSLSGAGALAAWRRKLGYEPMTSGLTPTRYLDEIGLLRGGVCLAHCVHLSEDEIDLIASSGASVAHCPRSNAYLGAGIAPLASFVARKVAVGIGTDSAASCMKLDFFEEMRFALGIHRAHAKDAEAITAKEVLKLATIGGARALGLENAIGTLEPGKRADMVALDMSAVLATEDIHLAILARELSDVVLTVVDGVEVVRDGHPVKVDIADCRARVAKSMERWTSD